MGEFSQGDRYAFWRVRQLIFSQIMREMGFKYDPSTAGSSVRFDPPNKNEKVSIHWVLGFVSTGLF